MSAWMTMAKGWAAAGCLCVVLLAACGAESGPQDREAAQALLKESVGDMTLSLDARLDAAADLVAAEGGPAYVVDRHGIAPDGFSGLLLNRLEDTSPPDAAALACRMLAVAPGEAKLELAQVLRRLGPEAAAAALRRLLEEPETDWQTRVQGLDVLGRFGSEDAAPTLGDHLRYDNVWVRIAAAHALAGLDRKVSVPLLLTALKDSANTVVTASLIALGQTGDSRARVASVELLTHRDPRIRGAAVSALGRLGGPGVREALTGMLDDADEGVRFKARKALGMLTR